MSTRQPSPEVVDSRGRSIPLGAILGRGGEGTVYEVKQSSAIAAKVYHRPLSADRSEKIRTMVRMRTDSLAKLMSWPVDLLAIKGTGRPIGLLMPMFPNRKNVHHLYGPKSRLQDFPKADWRFLVHAAMNIAKAFASVHDANCVIGDVNHGSILVAQDATAGDGVFCEAKSKFELLRTTLNQIPIKRMQALDQLKKDQRQLQLNRFLDGFDL